MTNARISFIPIVPSKSVSNFNKGKLIARMTTLGLDIVREAANYPPAQTSYRRTGGLGRRWTTSGPSLTALGLVVTVGNNIGYANRVMGFEGGKNAQLSLFRGFGWKSISKIGKEQIDRARPGLIRALQGL